MHKIALSTRNESEKIILEYDFSLTRFAPNGGVFWEQRELPLGGCSLRTECLALDGFCLLCQSVVGRLDRSIKWEIDGPHIALTHVANQGSAFRAEDSLLKVTRGTESTVLLDEEGGSEGACTLLLLSDNFFSTLCSQECWIKNCAVGRLCGQAEAAGQSYFFDFAVRRVIDALWIHRRDTAYFTSYAALKIKELFYLLQQQDALRITEHHKYIPLEVLDQLEQAKAYLLSHYRQAPTIKQISRMVSLNEFKLKYFFKQAYGTTIRAYVIQLRMEEAKQLLLQNWRVADVALHLGYKSVSHFILTYKRAYGHTPGARVNEGSTHPCKERNTACRSSL